MPLPDLALAHLVLRLAPLQRALRKAIAMRDAGARKLRDAGASAIVIARGHADAVLDQLGAAERGSLATGPATVSPEEAAAETALRTQAEHRLPLDILAAALELDPFECEVLVLCAAAELDLGYETVFAYVHDDAARRTVSVELASMLTASSLVEQTERRLLLGPFGRLRRLGLVAATPRETGLRDELRLAPACVHMLLGAPVDVGLGFRDPAVVALEPPAALAVDAGLVERAASALAAGRLDAIAIWGNARAARDVVAAIAQASRITVRRHADPEADPAAAVQAAAVLDSMLWIDLDALGDRADARLVEVCRTTRVPLLLTGANPWRPSELLAARDFVEIPIEPPDLEARTALWTAELPELGLDEVATSATSFRFDATEIRAVARTARASAALHTNGHVVATRDRLAAACLAVARSHGERYTRLVTPQRDADDLILRSELHARVLEIVHNFRAMPRVMDEWGFARAGAGAGIKALFTGEPGTGKTLAAEVIAKELALPLLKVDLARVVSKWIGETEKHLELVFAEAHDSHAVLFFDEAEALFGARGDVRHGSDRYANLEVSYLLQRLEDHSGVVVLATNLRDKIDPAFMRRFHAVIGFPRPAEDERRRMWQRAFTAATPIGEDLDLAALARLDLTGAGIVGTAQSAALLAAREGNAITMRHVVRGLVRQYQREARVLNGFDLGPHAVHMTA